MSRLICLALLVLASGPARAQTEAGTVGADTVRVFGEVAVRGAEDRPGVERIPVAAVLARDPESVADLARLVLSAAAPTNSRGQTLVAVRGVGERQTAVLFDGAPLTDPWDRRVDLALIPAGVVASVDVSRGPASLASGPNATGGVLDLSPRTLDRRGALTEAEVAGGLPARGRVSATRVVRWDRWQGTVALDAGARVGNALAAPLPFSQSDGALRTNTDRRSLSAVARGERFVEGGSVAATLLHVAAAQGVAPEGHLDPETERVRFWRIPDWRRSLAVVRIRRQGSALRFDATAHAGLGAEDVQPYTSATYVEAETPETSRDASAGLRLAVEGGEAWTVRALGTAVLARHRREEGAERETFRHNEGRLGVETEGEVGRLGLLAGIAVDGFAPTETAGRASPGAFVAPAWTLRATTEAGGFNLHAGLAQAARFPTMRELYGEALGRFALNPDLRPETTLQAEVGAALHGETGALRVAVFGRLTDDAIEQETLPDGRRRRVNLGGSRALGAEASAGLRRGPFRVDGTATALYLRGVEPGADPFRLPERPALLGRVGAVWLPPAGWSWAAEAVGTGPAISLGPDSPLDLPASVVVSGRLGYRWTVGRGLLSAYVRLDNALDAEVLPQAGLPAPGREVRVGLRWIR